MANKKTTIGDLAKITKAGFDETRKDRVKIRSEIDDLAMAVKSGFDGVDRRFDKVDVRLNKVDKRIDKIDKRLIRTEAMMVTKDYLDDRLADLKGDVIAIITGDGGRDKLFKTKLLAIIKRNKLAKESELQILLKLAR